MSALNNIIKMSGFVYDIEYYDAAAITSGTLNYRLFPRTAQTGGLANYRGNPFPFDKVQWLKATAAMDLEILTEAMRLVLLKTSVTIQKGNVTFFEGSLWSILGPSVGGVLLNSTTEKAYYNYTGNARFLKPIVLGPNDELAVNVSFGVDPTALNGKKLVWFFRGLGSIGVTGVR